MHRAGEPQAFYLLFRRVGMLAKLYWSVAGLNLLFFVAGWLGMLPGAWLTKVFVPDLAATARYLLPYAAS